MDGLDIVFNPIMQGGFAATTAILIVFVAWAFRELLKVQRLSIEASQANTQVVSHNTEVIHLLVEDRRKDSERICDIHTKMRDCPCLKDR